MKNFTYYTIIPSPLGDLTLSSDGEYLTGIWNYNQKYHGLDCLYKDMQRKDDLAIFADTANWLEKYFAGEKPAICDIKISLSGASEFRQAVWQILCDIPYGAVLTYGDIAKKLATKKGITRMSSQAVGGAVGHNPISIIVPCHRVVGTGGSLTGYAGGLDIKIKLLELEGVDCNGFFRPKKGTAL